MSEVKKYYIRFSKRTDYAALQEFYQTNKYPNVRNRRDETMEQIIRDGAVILIESEEGQIVAASATFPHKVTDPYGVERVAWQEIGKTQALPVVRGFPGLFDALVTIQTLRTALVEPPESVFVARMRALPMQQIAEKLGWRRMEGGPPQALIEAKFKTVCQHAQDQVSDWFACGVEGLPTMAKWMSKVLERNFILERQKSGEKIELDFSRSTFFRMFEAEILRLADKCFGDPDKLDMGQNLRVQRDKWMKSFYR